MAIITQENVDLRIFKNWHKHLELSRESYKKMFLNFITYFSRQEFTLEVSLISLLNHNHLYLLVYGYCVKDYNKIMISYTNYNTKKNFLHKSNYITKLLNYFIKGEKNNYNT